ncbi:hypothetical protein Pan258_21850 [Symmachiella dynata]|uniref:hypothetical protein n=1 Tax=Symmachiella dynata TaxID=2527995 RepID=UPI00118B3558|nr:hypothetical protein [Symmachiella dynata]QDT48145.1 hypothetical protein Pan258_21850 [Symmachiella dynata]
MISLKTLTRISTALLVVTAALASWSLADEKAKPAKTLDGLPLIFEDDFETGEAKRWLPANAEGWKVTHQGDNHVYSQHKSIKLKTPYRSPYNRAFIKDLYVSDFVLDVQLQSTIKDYGHRDLCMFFGYQDPSHLYYVHLGKKMDPHANNIFIVNDADRKSISTKTTDGTNWDDDWHHARVVRNVESGTIDIYFDDMETPVMTAVDKNFTWGQVGIGSFDDTGNFDDILLYGKKVDKPKQ